MGMNQGKGESKSTRAEREEEILAFWRENSIFEKSLEQTKDGEEFVFYDGPPFATGLPHYGHILPGTIKDIIPRYQTMKGRYVPRRWGWDCHGLPVENEIEKELGLNTRKEIEEYGIDTFNETAREAVQRYADEWRDIIPRTGRWVDMDNDYRTMDPDYTESIWWSFSKLYSDNLIYKGFKSMHICPRCETTLSNFEVTQGYEEIKDISVTAEFALADDPATRFLAWTTTPWTLPGNVALAVNPNIAYVTIEKKDEGGGDLVRFILAKDKLDDVFGDDEYKIVEEVSGTELVGKTYNPPFDYYTNAGLENAENAWKVYAADFVTTDEGTGIVHIAPTFGSDDLELSQKENLPMIQHINKNGTFKEEVTDFADLQAKPKEDPTASDVEIIKWLAHNGKLFSKKKITHSYPHCWRCDTPLLNYATSSWFVGVTGFRDKLVAENKEIHWVPEHIGQARFGNWLEDARDWAISRTRYWGAPLPVWVSNDPSTGSGQAPSSASEQVEMEVISSREELHQKAPEKVGKIFLMRHGESEKNVKGIFDNTIDTYPLTEKGKEEARKAAQDLKGEGIDLVVASPVRRARETAEIVAAELDCDVLEHEGLREIDSGEWEGKSPEGDEIKDEVSAYHNQSDEDYYQTPRGKTGESWDTIEKRAYEAIMEVLRENPGKTVLFATHQGTLVYAMKALHDWSISYTRNERLYDPELIAHATPTKVYIDVERAKSFDFHRPYIDAITYTTKDGKVMRRIEDVFDCWYESGSMSFAASGFTGETETPAYFPANFIAEGLDQTRGWFYSMLVLGVALFDKSAYQSVVVNGTILAEDGSKMSKRKKNYPDPMEIINKYGADSLRYYLMASPAVRAEPLNFSEDGVNEVMKKVIGRLNNVVSFYELYSDGVPRAEKKSEHVLDRWISARLNDVIGQITRSLDAYELDKATRPIGEFVDDLSTWYLRRSRERIKGENGEEERACALATLRYVLVEFSKVMAPTMPFMAEEVYGRVEGEKESVHLESWPESTSKSKDEKSNILEEMKEVRELISQALELRSQEGIKVRQPLAELKIRNPKSEIRNNEQMVEIIKSEINVKKISFGEHINKETELDTELTDELKQEGAVRELIRAIQDLRKNEGLNPSDKAALTVSTNDAGQKLVKEYQDEITKTAGLSNIQFSDVEEGKKASAHDYVFSVSLNL